MTVVSSCEPMLNVYESAVANVCDNTLNPFVRNFSEIFSPGTLSAIAGEPVDLVPEIMNINCLFSEFFVFNSFTNANS